MRTHPITRRNSHADKGKIAHTRSSQVHYLVILTQIFLSSPRTPTPSSFASPALPFASTPTPNPSLVSRPPRRTRKGGELSRDALPFIASSLPFQGKGRGWVGFTPSTLPASPRTRTRRDGRGRGQPWHAKWHAIFSDQR